MSSSALFTPLKLGALQLKHRVVMAPLTRMRSDNAVGGAPHDLNKVYYEQRASDGGLIISEATQISQQGQGYPGTPGIHNEDQIRGWKAITDAVHAKGGYIFLQLWHTGRVSGDYFQTDGKKAVSASDVAIGKDFGKAMTDKWQQVEFQTPRAATESDIKSIVEDYATAAANSKQAGFDGVEVHAANGYLLDQFLQDNVNTRSDQYGGSIDNRMRLLTEVIEAVAGVYGADRVGVRLSPWGTFNDMQDSDKKALFRSVLKALDKYHLAYAHIITPRIDDHVDTDVTEEFSREEVSALLKDSGYSGPVIGAGGFKPASAKSAIRTSTKDAATEQKSSDNTPGFVDAVAFGRLFIANPDLPKRLQLDAKLNSYDRSTFYGGDQKGYTDYPFLDQSNI